MDVEEESSSSTSEADESGSDADIQAERKLDFTVITPSFDGSIDNRIVDSSIA